jgi:hypothetical protein
MGALCVYGLYAIPIRMIDPGQTQTTAASFCTFPAVSDKEMDYCEDIVIDDLLSSSRPVISRGWCHAARLYCL